jgi:ubiquinone/menaquinone biosynthesis C-methylase UbiE
MASEEVYLHPDDYDLEVNDRDVHDLPFWISVMQSEQPRNVLEVGCGTGRLTVPLARDGVDRQYAVTGIDPEHPMLERARSRRSAQPTVVRNALELLQGDIRTLSLETVFDVVLMPYGAAHHLLSLQDQLSAWSNARRHTRDGGLFSVDVDAPNMAVLHRLMSEQYRRATRHPPSAPCTTTDITRANPMERSGTIPQRLRCTCTSRASSNCCVSQQVFSASA